MTALSEDYGADLPDYIPTCWERFQDFVHNHSDSLALVAVHQPANLYGMPNIDLDHDAYRQKPYLRWTFGGLGAAVDKMAYALTALGVRKGMTLFTVLPNGAEYLISLFAANKLGCAFTPFSSRNFVNIEEVTYMIKVAEMNAISDKSIYIIQDASISKQIESIPGSQQAVKIIVNGSIPNTDWIKLTDIFQRPSSSNMDRSSSDEPKHVPNDECIFFTSGTTSLPKGCRWVHPQVASLILVKSELPGNKHGDKWCAVVPNNHFFGYICCLFALCQGTCIVYPGPNLDPQIMYSVLQQEKCNYVALVPPMVLALCAIKAATGQSLSHLKGVILAGSVIAPDILFRCVEELGAKEIENGYGEFICYKFAFCVKINA
jgi:acyl-CoA synthetase (AMP-forming)/AMP-acid ligase II